MKHMRKLLLAALLGPALLVGCGSDEGVPSYSDGTPTSSANVSDEDINNLALEITWDGLPPDEQADLCVGWILAEDRMLDSFMQSADGITRAEARAFFSGKCN